MKALSLWQPWASLIVHGLKEYETRSWPTRYRGLLAIHAAKHFDTDCKEYCEDFMRDDPLYGPMVFKYGLPKGAVLGIARLVDCTLMQGELLAGMDYAQSIGITEREARYGYWEPGRYAWKMEMVETFKEPIPAKGMQGLWEWAPPVESVALEGRGGGE